MSVSGFAATSLASWLQYIESIHHLPIDLDLGRIRAVSERLPLVQSGVVITVGGTNGKGSTCAILESILRAAGYRTALYTSPHLLRFNERARINGEVLDDASLIKSFAAVEAARGATSLSYFEFTTLAVLQAFSAAAPDVTILEVGLGGRLDAVNIIDADCAIVTSIALDHMDWLGHDREAIGFEKAHIFRPGQPAICGDPDPPASLREYAQRIGADLWCAGADFSFRGDTQQWHYQGRVQKRHSLAYPALRGANQLLNASAALAALEALSPRLVITQQAVRQGLLEVTLAGRYQSLPGRPSIVLDVAHNPHAAAVLAQNLDRSGFYPATHAVIGVLNDKDLAGILAPLLSRIDHWYCATLDGPRGLTAASVAQALTQQLASNAGGSASPTINLFNNPALALQAARAQAQADDRILVFGSFLTVAGALAELGLSV